MTTKELNEILNNSMINLEKRWKIESKLWKESEKNNKGLVICFNGFYGNSIYLKSLMREFKSDNKTKYIYGSVGYDEKDIRDLTEEEHKIFWKLEKKRRLYANKLKNFTKGLKR